ncbi:gfo/Idh/MocA family oxidoreductase [Candidatus Parcubacteria bacterium]|nr:MAG: gfo/Idh/MocA family oxidoreductase [Candidatus Parcubacteria bacterium]
MKNIRISILGLGYWGPNIVRNLLKVPGAEIVSICDLDEKKVKNALSTFPTVKATSNYKEIILDKSIDAVAVATPTETHFKIAKEALEANKNVLIEKPMTKTSKEASELITLARKKKKILMVGHTFVYSEPVRMIKKIIESKRLGKIYYYDSTRINLGIIRSDSNVIWDLAPHDLSILGYIFQEDPISLQAFGSSHINQKSEEMAHIIIKYRNNLSAHIHVSWLSPVKIRTTIIGGSKKMVVYNDIEPSEKIKIYDKSIKISPAKITPFSPAYRSGDVVIPHLEEKEALLTELTHFIECIKENKKPLTDGTEGLRTIQLLEATDNALKTKSEVKVL